MSSPVTQRAGKVIQPVRTKAQRLAPPIHSQTPNPGHLHHQPTQPNPAQLQPHPPPHALPIPSPEPIENSYASSPPFPSRQVFTSSSINEKSLFFCFRPDPISSPVIQLIADDDPTKPDDRSDITTKAFYIANEVIDVEEDSEHEFKAVQDAKNPIHTIIKYCKVHN